MLRELEQTLLAKLRGTDTVPPTPILLRAENILTTPQTQPAISSLSLVPTVTMQVPDEWVASATLPSMNIWRLSEQYDASRFRTGIHSMAYTRPDGTPDIGVVTTKTHQIPIKLVYEFGIKARLEEHMDAMRGALFQRFRVGGYGSAVNVLTADGLVQVTFAMQHAAELTEDNRTGERLFEERFTYEFDAWFDAAGWAQERTILTIDLAVYTRDSFGDILDQGNVLNGPITNHDTLDRVVQVDSSV
jgi:hypothetical protein